MKYMDAKHLITILLVIVLLGCVQSEYKPIMFPKITPTPKITKQIAKVTPTMPNKPSVKPTIISTPEVKPTLTPFNNASTW